MDALSTASPFERVALMKGAQTGGSEAGLNWLGYVIQNAPGIAMLVMPSLDMVRRNTTVRIDPLIEATPALRELVAAPRSRDAGNSLFRKSFPGGQLVMTGANSAVGLRSTPVRYLFLDEVDSYPGDADGEGDPVDLAIQRTATFRGRRKIYMVSTPTLKGHSRIEAAFEHSDRRFYHVPCLHCGDMAPLTWARIRWPEGQREAPLLEKLNEHGEIKAGTMADAREAYKVETWARKIGVTRQVLVNDDLGAFSDLARRMGQAAAETEARILVTLLEAGSGNGPTLSDGKTLFHADHGNKAGTGAAISDATLSAARLALRTQKGVEDRTIRVTPRNLLVPPALETTAEKWLASIAPATAADVNPFSGSLSLVVEPRLSSATRWYVTADPGEIDGLEFAYLSGAEGPQVESRSGWDVDGVEIRVILDFGAGFIDHRGWFMNAGA